MSASTIRPPGRRWREARFQSGSFAWARICVWIGLLALVLAGSRAQSPYQLEAAVLGNLPKFVEWPAASFSNPQEPIRLGILGDDPFGSDLEKILKPVKVKGRGFVIQRSRRADDLGKCHVVFIHFDDSTELAPNLAKLKGRPILLVGDHSNFLQAGGAVKFHIEDRKVRFAINLDAASAANLSLHPQLLKLATRVQGKEPAK